MRKISANYIYTCTGKILNKGIIELDDTGKILNIIDTGGKLKEIAGLEFYSGILVPGFVNAHCHVELSHMKGVLQCKKEGLPKFIDEIIKKRFTPENLQETIAQADKEMYDEGIVAVGDISNTDDSFSIKKKSKIFYHTFVEVFTINNALSEDTFKQGLENIEKLKKLNLKGEIVPHASYSVPDKLWDLIKTTQTTQKRVISVHNMETESENLIFPDKKGELFDVLKNIGFNFNDFKFDEDNSESYLHKRLNPNDNILLVHNSYCTEKEISDADKFSDNIYRVLCPNSNLYIENNLPDINLFYKKGQNLCLGTDSYSSNERLSILSEMKTVVENFPEIPFSEILKWATINGSKALMIDNFAGTIETGKTPGINLISDFDFDKNTIKEKSEIKKII